MEDQIVWWNLTISALFQKQLKAQPQSQIQQQKENWLDHKKGAHEHLGGE